MTATSGKPGTGRYDLVGDIHGYVDPLRHLLEELGYQEVNQTYSHPEGRQVVFLGDFIDRGPAIRETLHLVRNMVEEGSALAVMGNHEFNAVCFHTPDGRGGYLRSRTADDGKNVKQHQATLDAFARREEEWAEWIDWFKDLPFFLDLGSVRAIHASWDEEAIRVLENSSLQDSIFLREAATPGTPGFSAIERALKGVELDLPEGRYFTDKQGVERPHIRVRWWENGSGKTYRQLVFPDCDTVPDSAVDPEATLPWNAYGSGEPPVFFGHYWLPPSFPTKPVAPNAACLDYSVAQKGGRLAAYRWNGEGHLSPANFKMTPTTAKI